MSYLDLARLREIAEAADHPTETPWGTHDRGIGFEVVWHGDHGEGEGPFRVSLFDDDVASRVNATHIAAFDPPTVLALLDEIERLRGAYERAWWWEEADEDYVFSAGEPYRRERVDGVLETKEALVRSYIRVRGYAKVFRFFRDTRWTPPVKPLRVGDVIETAEDAERFTAYDYGKAAVIDRDGYLWTTAGRGRLALDPNRVGVVDVLRDYGPLTVIHVPAVDDD